MFLNLPHTNLDVYKCSRQMVLECYKLSKMLPDDERFALVQQIRRAATSVSLNLAEGCSSKTSPDRRRFFEMARSSVVEIDSIIDHFYDLHYCTKADMQPCGDLLLRIFKMLSSMMSKS